MEDYIGFCVSEEHYPGLRLRLSERINTSSINRTFIRFESHLVDFHHQLVAGERYDHNQNEWVIGTFPIPRVIFIQCKASPVFIRKIKEASGAIVFNDFIFDKWQSWMILSRNQHLYPHLPETRICRSVEDINYFMESYKDFLIKPIMGDSSQGIVRINKKDSGYSEMFVTNEKDVTRKWFTPSKEFQHYLCTQYGNGEYVLQQKIQTISQGEQVTDIRTNMNKNGAGEWEQSLLLFRIATNSSVVIPKSISAYLLKGFLNSRLYDQATMGDIEQSILHLAREICHTFDRSSFHMADFGIDLGLDKAGKLWIFEVNPLPFPTNGAADNRPLSLPIQYADYLIKQ
ncbi:YheC/YheD family protein [Pontibacillus salicampi]|uniref:YheC/YheD family protein n=1 Tax=Pontibacillus salicampi TaxID=1449801 RepID=A0ABV6LK24_9BACI